MSAISMFQSLNRAQSLYNLAALCNPMPSKQYALMTVRRVSIAQSRPIPLQRTVHRSRFNRSIAHPLQLTTLCRLVGFNRSIAPNPSTTIMVERYFRFNVSISEH